MQYIGCGSANYLVRLFKTMKQQKYEFLKGFDNRHITIGFGSYGQVKLARNTATGEQVAIKFIYNKNAREQITMHTQLQHPNIVRLLNHFYQEEKNITYMVLQYVNGGTLFEKIKTSNISKKVQKKIFGEVCSAVAAMHASHIMHRDIKPQNILLTKNCDAKLCDFGFATIVADRKTLCGTYEYMAPQMIQDHKYGQEVDVWALGILLFQMVEGMAPFRGQSPTEVLNQMKKSIYFSDRFDEDQIQLIRSILRVNPKNRPSAAEILKHKYFQITKKDSIASTCSSSEYQQVGSEGNKLTIPCQNVFKQKRIKTFQQVDSPLSPKIPPVHIGFGQYEEPSTPKMEKHKFEGVYKSPEKSFTMIAKTAESTSSPSHPLMKQTSSLSHKCKKNLDMSVQAFSVRSEQYSELDMSSCSSSVVSQKY